MKTIYFSEMMSMLVVLQWIVSKDGPGYGYIQVSQRRRQEWVTWFYPRYSYRPEGKVFRAGAFKVCYRERRTSEEKKTTP